MDRALVALSGDTDETERLRLAGEWVAGVDAELVDLSMISEADAEQNMESLERVADIERTSDAADVAGSDQAERAARPQCVEGVRRLRGCRHSGIATPSESLRIAVRRCEERTAIVQRKA